MTPISPNKRALLELEAERRFVFHGSGEDVEILEPRQAENFVEGLKLPDGPPAVFASRSAEHAIFMALFSSRNCPGGYQASSGTEDGRLVFRTTKESLAGLKEDAYGFVYVLSKSGFSLRDSGGVEYVSLAPMRPLQKFRVNRADLPAEIGIVT